MISDCREAGLPEPEFKQQGPHFVVTLWRDWLTEEVLARLDLNEQQMLAVKHLKSAGRISNSEYRKLTGASESTALRELRQLAALGIVRKSKETGQSAHYVYVKTEPVTNPSNPSAARTKGTRHEPVKPVTDKSNNPGLTATVTLKNKRFNQEKREKSESLAGTKSVKRGAVTPQVVEKATTGAQSKAQSGAQSDNVLAAIEEKPLAMAELVSLFGLETKTGALKRTVKDLLMNKLVAYSLPDKPNSRLQKYRLTHKGRALLDTSMKKGSKA
jgi:DNA-binding HxlR family transcriptional regulator